MSAAFLMQTFGSPGANPSDNCAPVTNPVMKQRIVTVSVGPFRVTGDRLAVADLRTIFADVAAKDAKLYASLGSAGMLCFRHTRGSTTELSNHSWGDAVDLTINGILTQRGATQITSGLLALYPYFHAVGWYWGAGFSTPDAMHFEMGLDRLKSLYQLELNG